MPLKMMLIELHLTAFKQHLDDCQHLASKNISKHFTGCQPSDYLPSVCANQFPSFLTYHVHADAGLE